MKKYIFIFIIMLPCFTAQAQKQAQKEGRRTSLTLSAGVASEMYGSDMLYSGSNPYSLSGIYEPAYSDYENVSSVFSLSGEYFLNNWVTLGGDLSWAMLTKEILAGVTRKPMGEASIHGLYIMPSVKLYWISKERIKFFSGLYTGGLLKFSNAEDGDRFKFNYALDFAPVGMRVSLAGRGKVFATAETFIGTRLNGFRIGIGMAF